jgi:hypothetical protein
MKMWAYFIKREWGSRGFSISRTEPGRYASLLSQSLRGITHKVVEEPVIVIALSHKRLSDE